MSLREWDRKVTLLENELSSLTSRRHHKSDAGQKRLMRKLRSIKTWQFRLERSLAFIHSLVRRKHFLALQEKTLLHWASEFTEKTHAYYRSYLGSLNTLVWAKLVEARSLSVTWAGVDEPIDGPNAADTIRAYQQELQATRQKLVDHLKSLEERKTHLRERYEALVVCHVNDQALARPEVAARLSPVDPYVLGIRERLRRQGATPATGSPFEKMESESAKLTRLTACPQRIATAGARPAETALHTGNIDLLLQTFDYMNLERIDPRS